MSFKDTDNGIHNMHIFLLYRGVISKLNVLNGHSNKIKHFTKKYKHFSVPLMEIRYD